MLNIDRRSLLFAFGIASVSRHTLARPDTSGKVAVVKPGDSLFAYSTTQLAKLSPCKLTSEESGGACSAFEISALPMSGPYLHVHHREDEWYYVLSGEFLFKAGGEPHNLPTGASIWLPRGIPHVWANMSAAEAKLVLVCLPGGFEKFFNEMGTEMASVDSTAAESKMKEVMAKYGMELLGPPLFKPLRQQH